MVPQEVRVRPARRHHQSPTASPPHPYRPAIPPVPVALGQPLWSVMIPTYHCGRYLRDTLASVLAQDLGTQAMQIEVVDDHSLLDDPAAVVTEVGRGRVGFYRQEENVGVPGNFQTCLERSHGQFVHLLHGDDYVRQGFYRKMQQALLDHPAVGAAFCRHIYMDAAGHWQDMAPLEQPASGVLPNSLARLATEQRIMTPSMVVRRAVYEHLGGFDRRLRCSEDWEMWVRIAAHYPIWYEAEPLAVYRMHQHSNTGRHLRTAEDVQYTRQAIEIFRAYLPDSSAAAITRQARQAYALAALETAYRLSRHNDLAAARAQVAAAFACCASGKVLRRFLWLVWRGSLDRVRAQHAGAL